MVEMVSLIMYVNERLSSISKAILRFNQQRNSMSEISLMDTVE